MSHADKELYEFADFRLDVAERLLLKNGARVQLPDKAFEILCLLIKQNNHLVSKNEMLEKVWAGAFVEENNLDKNISSLRHALGEQRRQGGQKFIETVRGRGYRFVAEARRVAADEAENDGHGEAKNNKDAVWSNVTASSSPPRPRAIPQTGKVVALSQWRRDEADEKNSQSEKADAPETIEEQSIVARVEALPETTPPTQTNIVAGAKPIAESNIEKPAHKSKTRLTLMAALSLVALAGIGFAVYKFANPAPLQFEAKNIKRLTISGRVKVAAVSPDGKFVIYSQEEFDGQQSLWMQHIGSESSAQIVAPAAIDYRSLNISPDGNSIYFIDAQASLFKMPVMGGASKKIIGGLHPAPFRSISFSPDGKQITFVRRIDKETVAIFTANADGTNERKLASFEGSVMLSSAPAWSPDGKIIACDALIAGSGNMATVQVAIATVQVADGTSKLLFPQNRSEIGRAVWLPDSKSLLTDEEVSNNLYQISQVFYPSGEVRRVTHDTSNYRGVSLTADGRSLITVRNEQVAHIWTMPSSDITQARQITTGYEKFDGTIGLEWTPDGKILFNSTPSGKPSSWTIEPDGSNARALVNSGCSCAAAVSPDNRYLVYPKSTENGMAMWRMDLSDGSERQLAQGNPIYPTFSPDGKWIVYTSFAQPRIPLMKLSAEGGEPTPILGGQPLCPAFSPDGKTIAVVMATVEQPGRIALVSFESGEIIKTFDTKLARNPNTNNRNIQWTADGRGIYFVALENGVSNIWQQPIDGSPPVQVTDFKDGRIFNFAFSADGSQLALSRGTFNSDVVLIENQK